MNKDTPTVYMVQSTGIRVNTSHAETFGKLYTVFPSPKKPYNTQEMIEQARSALEGFTAKDYLCFIGDPLLGAVCMSIALEFSSSVTCLSWDNIDHVYIPTTWSFEEFLDDNNYHLFDDNNLGE
jgi:hypothetical protein